MHIGVRSSVRIGHIRRCSLDLGSTRAEIIQRKSESSQLRTTFGRRSRNRAAHGRQVSCAGARAKAGAIEPQALLRTAAANMTLACETYVSLPTSGACTEPCAHRRCATENRPPDGFNLSGACTQGALVRSNVGECPSRNMRPLRKRERSRGEGSQEQRVDKDEYDNKNTTKLRARACAEPLRLIGRSRSGVTIAPPPRHTILCGHATGLEIAPKSAFRGNILSKCHT